MDNKPLNDDCCNIPITLTDPAPNCSATESRNASPEKDQSRKSESFALDALSPLWTRDRAVGTAPRRLRASPVPPVQTGIHSGQVERLTDKLIPVDLGITGLAQITAVDLPSHPP